GHLAVGLDVTSVASLQAAKTRILEKYGRVDVLVNNAAINDMFENPLLAGQQSMFEHYPLEMWDRSWKVNVSGVFLCSQVPGGVENQQDAFFKENYSRKTLLGRMAAPSDYKGAIVFLASDASGYMTGGNLVVDRGWTAI